MLLPQPTTIEVTTTVYHFPPSTPKKKKKKKKKPTVPISPIDQALSDRLTLIEARLAALQADLNVKRLQRILKK